MNDNLAAVMRLRKKADSSYLNVIDECMADQERRRHFMMLSYADYEREVRGASGLEELIALHGAPKTADGVEIKIGMMAFLVVDLSEYEGPSEWGVQEKVVENFDFIFNHWLIKVQRRGPTLGGQQLYSTQLAATGLAVQLYRNEIKEIEAKIKALGDFSGDDHPDSAEN